MKEKDSRRWKWRDPRNFSDTEHNQLHPPVPKIWIQGGEQNRKESEGSDSEDPVRRQKQPCNLQHSMWLQQVLLHRRDLPKMRIQTKGTPRKSSPHKTWTPATSNQPTHEWTPTTEDLPNTHQHAQKRLTGRENAKIVGREQRWTQRKFLEGIESPREKNKGITPLNSFNQLEQWQSTQFPFSAFFGLTINCRIFSVLFRTDLISPADQPIYF